MKFFEGSRMTSRASRASRIPRFPGPHNSPCTYGGGPYEKPSPRKRKALDEALERIREYIPTRQREGTEQ